MSARQEDTASTTLGFRGPQSWHRVNAATVDFHPLIHKVALTLHISASTSVLPLRTEVRVSSLVSSTYANHSVACTPLYLLSSGALKNDLYPSPAQ